MPPVAGVSPVRHRVLPHIAAVLVATIVFALIYDPFHAGAISFLALAPIALVFADPRVPCSLPRAALCGFSFGLLAALAIVGPWMYAAAVDYFDRSMVWSFSFTLAVNAAYVAAFYAPVFVAVRLLAATPPVVRVFGIASVWIAFEALRAADPVGNSWALLGQGLVNLPLLPEAAAFGGVWILGWAAALCGSAIGVALQSDVRARDSARCSVIAFCGPLLLVALAMGVRFGDSAVAPLRPLRVAVVQSQIAGRDVWDPAKRVANWNEYLAATESIAPGTADLVVWPENAVPFLLSADSAARTRLADLATRLDAAILLGAPRSEDADDGHADMFNSAWFFAPGAPQPLTYDKQRLLPYVEVSPTAVGGPDGPLEYKAGTWTTLFELRGWRIAPLLCFEAVYPQYARAAVVAGANLLVNLSNDAWFAGGAGPEQHHAMSVLRTVELRRPMVRVANGGVSGAVGPDGVDIGFPIRRQKAVRTYEIPPPPRAITMAATHGSLVPWIAGALAVLALVVSLRPQRDAW